jgi:hypothetical protein
MKKQLYDALRPYCETDDIGSEFIPGEREKYYPGHKCLCGKEIVELCLIIHIKTGERFYVGNECISYFGFNPICSKCEIYETISNTAKLCSECRKGKKGKAPTGYVLLKKYKDFGYDSVYEKDKSYCIWVRDKMDPKYDIHFKMWLKRKQKLESIPII